MQIYDLLKEDHVEVKKILNEMINLSNEDEYRFVLVEELRRALIPHSRAEEAVFYNAIRAVDADKSLVSHSYKEHMESESFLRMLQVRNKADFDWRATAEKLLSSLEHHIQNEEENIFPEARKIFSDQEAESIGKAFVDLKPTFSDNGFMKNTVDMIINMLPPRLANGIRGLEVPKQ